MPFATRKFVAVVAILFAMAVIAYLAVFDPTVMPAPQCPFRLITGLDCPGCGSQRAIHAIFHGNFLQAWNLNPALFFAIPLAGLYAWQPKRLYNILYARATLWAIPAAIIAWWILRNVI